MGYDPAFWSRLQFAFTVIYHYLFPQLTVGLAWFLVYWKWRGLRTGNEKFNQAVRFWAKIFGLNFAVGVVIGILMETPMPKHILRVVIVGGGFGSLATGKTLHRTPAQVILNITCSLRIAVALIVVAGGVWSLDRALSA